MDEGLLLKFALICTFAGLIVLLFLTLSIDTELKTISELENTEFDMDVRIKGVVSSVNSLDKLLFLEIAQPQIIDVMVFSDKSLKIEQGDFVEITGQLREFNREQEIIADKINLLE